MISETGKNLSILIISEAGKDWQTFATWYSFYKNWPEASVRIFCHRNSEVPFVYFQWAKRLNVPCMKAKPFSSTGEEYLNCLNAVKLAQESQMIQQPVLVVKPLVMAIDLIDKKMSELLEKRNIWHEENAVFINRQNVSNLIDNYFLESDVKEKWPEALCPDAKETEILLPLVCCKKGCGRWIDTAKGCPFSSAGGLITSEMTASEIRVIELWKKMVPLYHAVA